MQSLGHSPLCVAVTGATGFIGRYLVSHLLDQGHTCRCWYRETSDRSGWETAPARLTWQLGELNDARSTSQLVDGCDAVVHAALDRPGPAFRGGEGELQEFLARNLLGTICLIEAEK